VRVLLDECLPRQLARELAPHSVKTVTKCGWSGVENGELLDLARDKFDVFLTIDRRLPRDHRPPPTLAIVGLVAVNNRVETLRALVPGILIALQKIRPGEVVTVSS